MSLVAQEHMSRSQILNNDMLTASMGSARQTVSCQYSTTPAPPMGNQSSAMQYQPRPASTAPNPLLAIPTPATMNMLVQNDTVTTIDPMCGSSLAVYTDIAGRVKTRKRNCSRGINTESSQQQGNEQCSSHPECVQETSISRLQDAFCLTKDHETSAKHYLNQSSHQDCDGPQMGMRLPTMVSLAKSRRAPPEEPVEALGVGGGASEVDSFTQISTATSTNADSQTAVDLRPTSGKLSSCFDGQHEPSLRSQVK